MVSDRAADIAPTPPFFAELVPGRRGEILDAALSVFASKGYENGTMREIAHLVGVSEPALYRHYAGKEALFSDLVATAADNIAGRAALLLATLEPERLHESLQQLFRARRQHVHQHSAGEAVMRTVMPATAHNAVFREVFRTHMARPIMDGLTTAVPRIDAAYGIVRSRAELESARRAFISLFVGYFMTGMMLDLPEDDAGMATAMMAVMGWTARD